MFSLLKDEKGIALIYVLFLSLILVVFTPIILKMTSATHFHMVQDENQEIANQLAISGFESFLVYLKEKPASSGDYESYFENYPGWGDYVIRTPEGIKVHYEFGPMVGTDWKRISNPDVPVGESNIKIRVTVGNDPLQASKELKYQITVPSGSGSGGGNGDGITVSPENVGLLDSEQDGTRVNVNPDGFITRDSYPNYQSDFNQLIPDATHLQVKVYTSPAAFLREVESYVQQAKPKQPYDTIAIVCDFNQDFTLDRKLSFDKKIVLYFNSANFLIDNKALLSMPQGMLLVNGNLRVDPTGSLRANNVFVTETATYNQQGGNSTVTVTGTFGSGTGGMESWSKLPEIGNNNDYIYKYPNSSGSPWSPKINQ